MLVLHAIVAHKLGLKLVVLAPRFPLGWVAAVMMLSHGALRGSVLPHR